jgi:hypothetical protein
MICEKCKLETSNGDNYTFYYGVFTSSGMPDSRHIQHNYHIAGSETIYICDQCLKKYSHQRMIMMTVLMLSMAILAFIGWFFLKDLSKTQLSGLDPAGFLAVCILMIFMVPVIFLVTNRQRKGKGRTVLGDSLAINLKKPALKSRGYDRFFTRENMSRMS